VLVDALAKALQNVSELQLPRDRASPRNDGPSLSLVTYQRIRTHLAVMIGMSDSNDIHESDASEK
jgi:hypothetical protein